MKFSSHAKWILSGEHSVVRGGKAIAFPLRTFESSVELLPSDKLEVHDTNREERFNDIFIGLLKTAAGFTNVDFDSILGQFWIRSDIKMKSGLGSSAAICTNVAKIFQYLGLCEDIFSLARYLEDKFHGKSSGLDIAVAIRNKALVFEKNRVSSVLEPKFWPYMMLTYSGKKSTTSECALKVREISVKNKKFADSLDDMMNQGSDLCEYALKNGDFEKLKDGITLCNEAFHGWGLYNEALADHVANLMKKGAVAVKPIGSGLGGFVLSLWEEQPQNYENISLTLQKP